MGLLVRRCVIGSVLLPAVNMRLPPVQCCSGAMFMAARPQDMAEDSRMSFSTLPAAHVFSWGHLSADLLTLHD